MTRTDEELGQELAAQMHAFTEDDTVPGDLLTRVRRPRRSFAGPALVAGGVAAAVVLAATVVPSRDGTVAVPPAAGGSTAPSPATAADPGPSDAELRAAAWLHVTFRFAQGDRRASESRWLGRDGRVVRSADGGAAEVISDETHFRIGERPLTWQQVLDLAPDAAALETELGKAQGGRPLTERVVDGSLGLLRSAPVLLPVRRALVDVLRNQPGVQVSTGTSDGRVATVLRFTTIDPSYLDVYVDPVSFRLLGTRLIAAPGYPAPPTDGPAIEDPNGDTAKPGDVLFEETYTAWDTTAPPTT